MPFEIFQCDGQAPITTNYVGMDNRTEGVMLTPQHKLLDSDRITKLSNHNPTSYHGVKVDGDLIFTIGWSQGFYIHRLENDGSVTELYRDSSPLGGGYYTSLAIHLPTQQAFVGHYSYDGLAIYDYSVDPTAPTKTILKEVDGLPFDRLGEAYGSAFDIAGDWLYMSPNEKEYTNCVRMNVNTQAIEEITVSNQQLNFRRNYLHYDSVNDQMFYLSSHSYNTDMFVVKNASTTNPACYGLNMNSIPHVDWRGRACGIYVDPTNENILTAMINYRIHKIDFSGIINSTSTTPTSLAYSESRSGYPNSFNGYGRIATHPERSDMLLILPERGGTIGCGWVDLDRSDWVESNRHDGWHGGKYTGAIHLNDYMSEPHIGTSANGTQYIVTAGHGWDYGLLVFPHGSGMFDLYENTDIQFGAFTMNGNQNISHVIVRGLEKDVTYWEPSGTTLTVWVSNDNGATWETYDTNSQTPHKFVSTGYQLKLKIGFNGLPDKTPYVKAMRGIQLAAISKNFEPERPTRRAFRRMRRGA